MAQPTKFQKGQLIVELLVAFGLSSILIPAVILGFISGSAGRAQQEQRLKGLGYLREAEEAVRSIRDANWSDIATNGQYHPVAGAVSWSLAGGSEVIGDFTRSIEISDVDPPDPSKKQVLISVSWNNILPINLTSNLILSRWRSAVATLTAGGELLGLGRGDWCAPSAERIVEFDLDKSGVANAISAIQGNVFAGTGDNASGPAFDNVLIPNTTYPTLPAPTLGGNYGAQPIKTNGIFGEPDYAYLTTDTVRRQGIIIDLTNLSGGQYSEIGTLDIGVANVNGKSIYVSGNIAYLSGTNGKIYAFDITNRGGSHSPVAEIDLGAIANKILIVGESIYAAVNSTSNQLTIIPVGVNGITFGTPVTVSVPGAGAVDVYVNSAGSRSYLATAGSDTQSEFFIIDSDPGSATYRQILGSYDSGGMKPKGVTVVPGSIRAILVGTGGTQQYQVIDLENETNPVHCTSQSRSGGLVIPSGVNGVASVLEDDGDAYSYIITGDAGAELKIIEGGPGGAGGNGGIFESPVFDAGAQVIFNRFSVIDLQPPDIIPTYQIAVSQDCTTFNYTGSYGADGGTIPLSLNPGRCFRYQVTFTGGGGAPSASSTVLINYSP
ncbi:MAG TPA: hypothetical protein VJ227_00900 [Patescibacteria group bacterium]|nr:hypothetical protein [Patescibacteria group bacterium]